MARLGSRKRLAARCGPRRWVRGTLVALFLAGTSSAGAAGGEGQAVVVGNTGPVEVTVIADRSEIGVADRLRLRVTVVAPPELLITFPSISDRLGPFAVVKQRAAGPTPGPDPKRELWRHEYLLEAEGPGVLTIPALTFAIQDSRTKPSVACVYLNRCGRTTPAPRAVPKRVTTEPVTIRVTTVLAADADITKPKDIAPPVGLDPPPAPLWPWGLAAGLIAVSALVLFWFQRRRRRRAAAAFAGEPLRPAHLLALEALRRLGDQDLDGAERIESFYVRLSDILRRYAMWRFGLGAPRQTTEEFLAAAGACGGPLAARRDFLSRFLRHCDLVKFARHRPGVAESRAALEGAIGFVEKTGDVAVRAPAGGMEA